MNKNTTAPVVCLINLGCAKNTADSERILGQLVSAGFMIAESPADADLCLVNTCGFINEAREECKAVLHEIQQFKQAGKLRAVIALGCMVQQAENVPEHHAVLAEADSRISFFDYPRIAERCRQALETGGTSPAFNRIGSNTALSHEAFLLSPRLRIGAAHTAYLKISEGCSHQCRFCTIPAIRGPQVSRSIDDIMQEARELIELGAREINLIAQDTTRYGHDLYGRPVLPDLLTELTTLPEDTWIRLMYAYPKFLSDEILHILASDSRFCPYIDMPLQHIADPVLKRMGRPGTDETRGLLERIQTAMPKAAIRTAFIVGFPGETDEQFEELRSFVKEGWFMHMGTFTYSHEPNTPAGTLEDTIPQAVKNDRAEQLMLDQREVSKAKMASFAGAEIEVMLDTPADGLPSRATWIGRTNWQAPEIDGKIYVVTDGEHEPGERLKTEVIETLEYDLVTVPV